jgi:hypothetical protein
MRHVKQEDEVAFLKKKTKHEVTFIASQILSNIYCMLYLTEMKVRPRFVSQNDGHFPLAQYVFRFLMKVSPYGNLLQTYGHATIFMVSQHNVLLDGAMLIRVMRATSCRRQKEFSFPVVNFVFVIGTSLTY